MIYRSNLRCPDLTRHFRHTISRPMPHSFGHDVLSDWADKPEGDPFWDAQKQCGFWTHDEAAILHRIVLAARRGTWADVGAHTGWTAAHLSIAAQDVHAIDPALALAEFYARLTANTGFHADDPLPRTNGRITILPIRSHNYFDVLHSVDGSIKGAVVDGDHDEPWPRTDSKSAYLAGANVIVFHDFTGAPVRRAAKMLVEELQMRVRLYWTPHIVACCWRPGFSFYPPDHVADGNLLAQMFGASEGARLMWDSPTPEQAAERYPGFPYERCE